MGGAAARPCLVSGHQFGASLHLFGLQNRVCWFRLEGGAVSLLHQHSPKQTKGETYNRSQNLYHPDYTLV